MLKVRSALVLAALAVSVPGASLAQSAPGAQAVPASAATADPLAYDDPGMHFRAPDGWQRIDLSSVRAAPSGEKAPPAAVFVYDRDKRDQRSIVIDIQPFEGTLEGAETSKESELRNGENGTFVDRKPRTTLANGMPAYFLKVSQPGGAVGNQLRRYDYIVYDLSRVIDVAYIGRYGDFDEDDARKALASLTVVVYPRGRR